jgi:hypothetical protein
MSNPKSSMEDAWPEVLAELVAKVGLLTLCERK